MPRYYFTLYQVAQNAQNRRIIQNVHKSVFDLEQKHGHLQINENVMAMYTVNPCKLIHVFQEKDIIRGQGKVTVLKATMGIVRDTRTNVDIFFEISNCVLAEGMPKPVSLHEPPLNLKVGDSNLPIEYFKLPYDVWKQMGVTNQHKAFKVMPYTKPAPAEVVNLPRPMSRECPTPAMQRTAALDRGPGPPKLSRLVAKEVKGVCVDDSSNIWVTNIGVVPLSVTQIFKKSQWVLLDVISSFDKLVGDKPTLARSIMQTEVDSKGNVVLAGEALLLYHHKETGEGCMYCEILGRIMFERGRCNDFELVDSKPGSSWIRFRAILRRDQSAWEAKTLEVLPPKGNPIGVHTLIVKYITDIGGGSLLCELVQSVTDVENQTKVEDEQRSRVLVTSNSYYWPVQPDHFAKEIIEKGRFLKVLALATKTSLAVGEISFRTLYAEPFKPILDDSLEEMLMNEIYNKVEELPRKVATAEEVVDPPDVDEEGRGSPANSKLPLSGTAPSPVPGLMPVASLNYAAVNRRESNGSLHQPVEVDPPDDQGEKPLSRTPSFLDVVFEDIEDIVDDDVLHLAYADPDPPVIEDHALEDYASYERFTFEDEEYVEDLEDDFTLNSDPHVDSFNTTNTASSNENPIVVPVMPMPPRYCTPIDKEMIELAEKQMSKNHKALLH